jgi:hypothetical protein
MGKPFAVLSSCTVVKNLFAHVEDLLCWRATNGVGMVNQRGTSYILQTILWRYLKFKFTTVLLCR